MLYSKHEENTDFIFKVTYVEASLLKENELSCICVILGFPLIFC